MGPIDHATQTARGADPGVGLPGVGAYDASAGATTCCQRCEK